LLAVVVVVVVVVVRIPVLFSDFSEPSISSYNAL